MAGTTRRRDGDQVVPGCSEYRPLYCSPGYCWCGHLRSEHASEAPKTAAKMLALKREDIRRKALLTSPSGRSVLALHSQLDVDQLASLHVIHKGRADGVSATELGEALRPSLESGGRLLSFVVVHKLLERLAELDLVVADHAGKYWYPSFRWPLRSQLGQPAEEPSRSPSRASFGRERRLDRRPALRPVSRPVQLSRLLLVWPFSDGTLKRELHLDLGPRIIDVKKLSTNRARSAPILKSSATHQIVFPLQNPPGPTSMRCQVNDRPVDGRRLLELASASLHPKPFAESPC